MFSLQSGTFAGQTGQSTCTSCPALTVANEKGSTQCKTCALDGQIPNTKKTDCQDPPWLTPKDCKLTEYLNDSSSSNLKWTCIGCPAGAQCGEEEPLAKLSTLGAVDGYCKCMGRHLFFVCSSHPDISLFVLSLTFFAQLQGVSNLRTIPAKICLHRVPIPTIASTTHV